MKYTFSSYHLKEAFHVLDLLFLFPLLYLVIFLVLLKISSDSWFSTRQIAFIISFIMLAQMASIATVENMVESRYLENEVYPQLSNYDKQMLVPCGIEEFNTGGRISKSHYDEFKYSDDVIFSEFRLSYMDEGHLSHKEIVAKISNEGSDKEPYVSYIELEEDIGPAQKGWYDITIHVNSLDGVIGSGSCSVISY